MALGNGGDDLGVVQRLAAGEADILEQLGDRVELAGQLAHRPAALDHDGQDLKRRHQAVAGGGMVVQDQVARLFAAQVEPARSHPLHDVTVADLGPLQHEAVAGQGALKAQVGHHGGDHAAALQHAPPGPVTADQRHDLVAVDHLAVFVANDQPVGVAVQGDADVGPPVADHGRQGLRVGRAAVGVDISPVGRHPDRNDLGPKFVEGRRGDLVAGTIGAIDGDAQAGQATGGEGMRPWRSRCSGPGRRRSA